MEHQWSESARRDSGARSDRKHQPASDSNGHYVEYVVGCCGKRAPREIQMVLAEEDVEVGIPDQMPERGVPINNNSNDDMMPFGRKIQPTKKISAVRSRHTSLVQGRSEQVRL